MSEPISNEFLSANFSVNFDSNSSSNLYSNGSTVSFFNKKDLADEFLTRMEVILLMLVFLLTVVGNLAVIFILLFFKNGSRLYGFNHVHINNKNTNANQLNKSRFNCNFNFNNVSRMSFYIIHLCIADISVALMSILPQILWRYSVLFSRSQFECKIVAFGQVETFF